MHLSDLHLHRGSPAADLATLWDQPARAIAGRRFDFIVVSGDLSQSAQPEEYDRLYEFSCSYLLPLLKDGISGQAARRRLIFVPGNHDVDWGHTVVGEPIQNLPPGEAERRSRQLLKAPLEARERAILKDDRLQICPLVDESSYAKRFANVQKFLNRFYRQSLRDSPNRPFRLTEDPSKGKDWALHHFEDPNPGIAFFCFNTCHANDKYWTGAHINPHAFNAARQAAENLPESTLKVAVWHHGLGSDRGSPDYLVISDLFSFRTLGCRIGLHGHVHEAAVDIPNLLKDQFVVVSTGSLGASRRARPEGVRNQFSVLRLFPTRVTVSLYSRVPQANSYEHTQTKSHEFGTTEASMARSRVFARKQSRRCEVAEDGICGVTVELEDVHHEGSVPLAVLHVSDLRVNSLAAWADNGALHVARCDQPDGSSRFSATPAREYSGHLRWQYLVPNVVSLSASELSFKAADPMRKNHPNLHQDEDAIAHTVLFDCDQLEFSLLFSSPPRTGLAQPSLAPNSARVLVERQIVFEGERRWVPLPKEANRCSLTQDTYSASLVVDAPLVGARYSLVFKPGLAGMAPSSPALDFARHLLALVGRALPRPGLDRHLTAYVGSAVRSLIDTSPAGLRDESFIQQLRRHLEALTRAPDASLLPGLQWTGHFWNNKAGMLQPLFGEFGLRTWGTTFRNGAGVAGHAFRFGSLAAWSRDSHGRTSLIYQDRTEDHPGGPLDYSWLIAVPILVAPGGPSLGVVSFGADGAGQDRNRHAAELSSIAHSIVATERLERIQEPSASPAAFTRRNSRAEFAEKDLSLVVNVSFWSALASEEALGLGCSRENRAFAESVLEAYGLDDS